MSSITPLQVSAGLPADTRDVVARELGIPRVVNTGDGNSRLSTGDWVRVDGTAGTIEILTAARNAT